MFVFGLILRGKVKRENLMFSIPCRHLKWKYGLKGIQYFPVTQQPKVSLAKMQNKKKIYF